MKIVFYIHALAGGGAERVWSVLASSLAQRGHAVVFAVDSEAVENRSGLDEWIRFVVLGRSHLGSLFALRRLLATEAPDVAVGALAAANLKLTLAAAIAGRLRRVVLTYHGYGESEPQRLSQLGFLALPLLSRLTGRTVAVSDGLLVYLRTRWRASAGRTMRIYNPVQVASFAMTADLADRRPMVLCSGRFTPYKNHVGLVRAFKRSRHSEARLVLLGDGPERGALEREIANAGLAGRVEMPGYVAAPWAFYAAASLFVLPSRSEAFGLVLVEAMAYGLDVVATDCDGPREILQDGRLGRLVPIGDEAALTAAIDAALDRPTDPAARVARARDFAASTAADGYEDLFRAVAADADGYGRTPIGTRRA